MRRSIFIERMSSFDVEVVICYSRENHRLKVRFSLKYRKRVDENSDFLRRIAEFTYFYRLELDFRRFLGGPGSENLKSSSWRCSLDVKSLLF